MNRLSPEQLAIVRKAVADLQEASGLTALADRTRAGEMDHLPMMQAAISAAAAALGAQR